MALAYLCDFDGTISPTDIGAALVTRFSDGAEEARESMLRRWRSGEMGHRELTVAECGVMTLSAAEAEAFIGGFTIDPAFAPFAREAAERGDEVMVVSEGFDFYVRAHLDRAGLGHLSRAANTARFEGGRIVPEFPFGREGCGRCGNCKAQHVRRWHAAGRTVVLVGDGFSDRCGAREADVVLARGSLLAWCGEQGIAAEPFENFTDVTAWARRVHAGRN